jgi:RNA-directed DNA polymerase
VVLHPTLAGVEKAKLVMEAWLQGIGLELKPSKTRIAHTLHPMQGKAGFDFLGMTIRQYPVGRTHSAKNTYGKLLGFKTLIKPSEEAIKRHVRALRKIVREQQTAPQAGLIAHLNPVIKGWANYYRTVVAKESYVRCDDWLYCKLRYWARRRHPNKTARWVSRKYWAINQGEGWTFKAQDGSKLRKHTATPIKRHVKVSGRASPYDGKLTYWAQRLKDHPLVNSKVGYLLKLQKGKCARCGLYFRDGDLMETDHIIPKSLGGDNRLMNLQLLHRHCHDQKTAQDGSNQAKTDQGINDNDHLIEEPDDGKLSRPVL